MGDDWTRLSKQVRPLVLARDGFRCQIAGPGCDRPDSELPPDWLEVDHITPRSVDPSRVLDMANMQAVCRSCHRRKSALEQGLQLTKGRRARTPRSTPMELTG